MRRRITVDEWNAEGVRRFGRPARKWLFICPACKCVQSGEDFLAAGLTLDQIPKYLGFSCVGRFNRRVGCDWTLGGLLHIHTLEVIDDEGEAHMRFEFADLYLEVGYEDKPVVKLRDSKPEDGVGDEVRPCLRVLKTGEEYWGFSRDLVPLLGVSPEHAACLLKAEEAR